VSKKRILDLLAILLVVVFFLAIFVLPPLKNAFLQIFCLLDTSLLRQPACMVGSFLIYAIPFLSASWLILRLFVKITKFASIVDVNSRLCKVIGMLYQKIKVLDG
jgi:hypothetical protein